MTIDFGAQVIGRFEAEHDVRCIETPAGEVVMTVHQGPYDELSKTHAWIHEWCRMNGKHIGAPEALARAVSPSSRSMAIRPGAVPASPG